MSRRKKVSLEPFEVTIDRINDSGAGVARHGEQVLAVWGALAGEVVEARLLPGRNFKRQAETLDVKHASPDRQTPPCPSFGQCSACTLQHMSSAAQLAFKQEQLATALESQGVQAERWLDPLQADQWHYRRKARLSVRNVPAKGRVLVGFRERDGRFVTDMRECHTLHPAIARLLEPLSDLIGQLDAASTIPQIEVATGDTGCALVFRHLEALSDGDLSALGAFARQFSLQVYLQPKGPATVHPLQLEGPALSYALKDHGIEMAFGPLDFVQVNGALNELMIAQALELLALEPEHEVLDLFCGLGNFTLPLARKVRGVTGLEGSDELVKAAQANAQQNSIGNATFARADLYSDSLAAEWPAGPFDRILLDPPRSGAAPMLAQLAQTTATRVLYVSCNPASLATDAGVLVNTYGYRLSAVGVMDMFPQTTHVETMALFERDDGFIPDSSGSSAKDAYGA